MKNSKKIISWFTVLILGLVFITQFIPAKGIEASEEDTAISFRFEGVVSSYEEMKAQDNSFEVYVKAQGDTEYKTLAQAASDNNGVYSLNADVSSVSIYITLNKDHYVYVKDNVLYTYNIIKEKTYKYKLKDNEKLNDASGSVISPYRNAIFVNNSSDKYIKIINFKGNQIKKIKNLEISSVELNKDNDKAFIIVKKNTNEGRLYGLYVAE